MKFEERMDKLYASDAMSSIEEGLEISVPVTVRINGSDADALLLWRARDMAELKKIITVDKKTAAVKTIKDSDITDAFNISALSYQLPDTENIDEYYDCKDRYEEVYCLISNDEKRYAEYGNELIRLLKRLFGEEMFDKLIMKICDEFINRLSESNIEINTDTEKLPETNKKKMKSHN